MAKEITTIKLRKSTAELLNRLKVHPRQPYEEIILSLVSGKKLPAHSAHGHGSQAITTIKLTKKTVELVSRLKIHPRQSYEEVILKLISENESNRKKSKK